MTKKSYTREEWKRLLDALERRKASAHAMGGEEKLSRHGRGGRLDARQRIEALLDPDSFRELGTLVGGMARGGIPAVSADALVAGTGRVDGRPVLVGSEDFTVKGGSIGLGTHAKRLRLARLAAQERVPLVMMLEGAGERATNALERYPHAPNDLQALANIAGRVPTVAVIMGPSAGHGALTALLMDFVVMVKGAASGADAETREALDAAESGGPWSTADTMSYDEVIDPRELRNVLLDALELTSAREEQQVGPRPGGIRP